MIPRVSIILSVYKRTGYLAESLSSALAQSYGDFEIIVADDSGTHASKQIVAACGDIERVNYLPNPTTLGIASSVARAVEHARGDLIAILNDDDIWEQNLLAELVAPLEADAGLVLATSDHWIMDASGHIDVGLSDSWSVDFGRALLPKGIVTNAAEFVVVKGGPAINISSVFRKDAVNWSLLVPDVAGAYDYWISCLLAATRRPIYYVPKRLGRWRVHGGMETSRRSHDIRENLVYIYSTMLQRGWFPELEAILKARLAEALFVVGRDKLQFDRAKEARSFLWQSFLLNHRPRALIHAGASFLPWPIRAQLKACLRVLRKVKGTPAEKKGQTRLGNIFSNR
jgi:glycosyltransferase involved in cell wall biosynthesis